VDWYLDTTTWPNVVQLRREIDAYLDRHADADTDLEDCRVVVSEVLTNAHFHAPGPAWVSLEWPHEHPRLAVRDLGPGFELDITLPPPDALGGRGLFLVTALAPELAVAHRRGGGSEVIVELPASRTPPVSYDPPMHATASLPDLTEAQPEGGFSKEAFLRALVVHLASGLEAHYGYDTAEAAVAQVGSDVGGQMEAEYRMATGHQGPLTPEQLAHCMVRLKAGIGGGFRALEATDERIVLVNDRCPFGDAVTRAPALCRMTSSVFGGLAARHSEHGVVVRLEERIAVGDPGCRVVIDLQPGSSDGYGHGYRPPTSPP